jgi:hypothetical protein
VAKAARGGSKFVTIGLGLVVAVMLVSALAGRWRPRLPRLLEAGHASVVRVQVLNGSGEGGVASRAAAFLRDGGFQVTEIRNADRSDYFSTFVVARRRDASGAHAVARYLGDAPVIRQVWGPELADVSLVIGSDRSRVRLGD